MKAPIPESRIPWYMLPGGLDENPVQAAFHREKYSWLKVNREAVYAEREILRAQGRKDFGVD